MVPFAKWREYDAIAGDRKSIIQRLNKSKARLVHGDVYSIPEAIGPLDVCVFGSTLLHFRDPFLAL